MSVEDALSILTSGGTGVPVQAPVVGGVGAGLVDGTNGADGTDLGKPAVPKKVGMVGSGGVSSALSILTGGTPVQEKVSPKDPFQDSNYLEFKSGTNVTPMSKKEFQKEQANKEAAKGSFLPTITTIGRQQEEYGKMLQRTPEQDDEYHNRYTAGESIAKTMGIDEKKVRYQGTNPIITPDMKKGLSGPDTESLFTYLSEKRKSSQAQTGKKIEEAGKQNLKYMELFSPYVEANLQDDIVKIQQAKPSIMNSLRTGNTQGAADEFVFDAFMSGDDVAIQKAMIVRNQLGQVAGEQQQEVKDEKAFGKELILSTAQMLPMMAKGAYYGMIPVVGPALSTSMWARQGAGEILADMEKEGVPRDVALPVALNAGLAYSLIESMQIGQIKNIGPIKEALNKPIKKKILYLVKAKGIDWVRENLEEIAQSLVQVGAVDVAKQQTGMEIDSKGFVKKYKNAVVETFKQSAGPMALLSVLGFGAGSVKIGYQAMNDKKAGQAQTTQTTQTTQTGNAAVEILTGVKSGENGANATDGTDRTNIKPQGKPVVVAVAGKTLADFGMTDEEFFNLTFGREDNERWNDILNMLSKEEIERLKQVETPTPEEIRTKTLADFGMTDEEFFNLTFGREDNERWNDILNMLSKEEIERLKQVETPTPEEIRTKTLADFGMTDEEFFNLTFGREDNERWNDILNMLSKEEIERLKQVETPTPEEIRTKTLADFGMTDEEFFNLTFGREDNERWNDILNMLSKEEIERLKQVETPTPEEIRTKTLADFDVTDDEFWAMKDEEKRNQIFAQLPEDEQDRLQGAGEVDKGIDIEAVRKRVAEVDRDEDEKEKMLNVNLAPSDGQKSAGNYKVAPIRKEGLDISIETPAGGIRKSKDSDPKQWQTQINHDYGYIKGTKGADGYRDPESGDQVDIFINPGAKTEGKSVYIVDQINPETGEFDEHKVMMGFDNSEEAKKAYLSNYEPGWKGLDAVTEMALPDFKEWVYSESTKNPAKEYVKPGTKAPGSVLFHGTRSGNVIEKFNLDNANKGVGSNAFAQGDLGVYLTSSETAAKYFSRKAGQRNALADRSIDGIEAISRATEALQGEKDGNIVSVELPSDIKIKELDHYPTKAEAAKYKAEGYDGLRFAETGFSEVEDYPTDRLPTDEDLTESKTTVIFDPGKIKVLKNTDKAPGAIDKKGVENITKPSYISNTTIKPEGAQSGTNRPQQKPQSDVESRAGVSNSQGSGTGSGSGRGDGQQNRKGSGTTQSSKSIIPPGKKLSDFKLTIPQYWKLNKAARTPIFNQLTENEKLTVKANKPTRKAAGPATYAQVKMRLSKTEYNDQYHYQKTIHGLQVDFANAMQFGFKTSGGVAVKGSQAGWMQDVAIVTGRRSIFKNLPKTPSENALRYLQSVVDAYSAEDAQVSFKESTGAEAPAHTDDVIALIQEAKNKNEFIAYHKEFERNALGGTNGSDATDDEFAAAERVFKDNPGKLNDRQREILEAEWGMSVEDAAAVQEQEEEDSPVFARSRDINQMKMDLFEGATPEQQQEMNLFDQIVPNSQQDKKQSATQQSPKFSTETTDVNFKKLNFAPEYGKYAFYDLLPHAGNNYLDAGVLSAIKKGGYKKNGYDGILAPTEENNGVKSDYTVVVFSPNQIKSATGNRGAFDVENPDIRFAKGDTVEEIPSTRIGNTGEGSTERLDMPRATDERSQGIEKRLSAALHRFAGVEFDENNTGIRVLSPNTEVGSSITGVLQDFTGKEVVWFESDASLDATLGLTADGISFPRGVSPDLANKIFINVNSSRPTLWVAGHELWHFIEQNPKFNDLFWNSVKVTAKGRSLFKAMAIDLKDAARSEFAADIVGEMITDPEFLEILHRQNASVFDKIFRKLIEILTKLSKSLKAAFIGEAGRTKEYESLIENVDEVRYALARILSSYRKSFEGGRRVDVVSDVAAAVMQLAGPKPSFAGKKAETEQINSPEFKKWFGDWENDPDNASKVVDKSGKPLVVYHGTDAEFDTFDATTMGKYTQAKSAKKGFFFTDNIKNAEVYAGITKEEFYKNPDLYKKYNEMYSNAEEKLLNLIGSKSDSLLGKSNDIQRYVTKIGYEEELLKKEFGDATNFDIDNIDDIVFIPTNKGEERALETAEEKGIVEKAKKLIIKRDAFYKIYDDMEYATGILNSGNLKARRKGEFVDGQPFDSFVVDTSTLKPHVKSVHLNLKNPYIHYQKTVISRDEAFSDIIDEAKKNGNDGIIIKGTRDPLVGNIYIVFSPNQIKSATENQGTFDSENPDIRFARSKSSIKTKEMMAKAKADLTAEKERVAELEREMNQMKGRLLSLPQEKLLERAEINLKIKSEKLEELDQIKNLILQYAKNIGIDGVGYNKVAAQVSVARSVRGLEKAVRIMDKVWEGARRVETVEALEKVLEKEYRRLNKVASGKLKSTIAPEYNVALRKYLDELTSTPDVQSLANGATPADYKGWVDKMLSYYNNYAQKDLKQANKLVDLPIEIIEWMEDPSKPVPEKISQAIKYLFKHTISTMTTDELVKVLDDIESLRATGRTVKMAEDFARELELNTRAESGAQVVKDATKDPSSSEETFLQAAKNNKLDKFGWMGKLAEKGLWSLIDAERMVEWLSGFKNIDVLKNSILKPLYAAEKTKMDNLKAAQAAFEKLHKDVDMANLYKDKLIEIDFKEVYGEVLQNYEGKESKISLTTNQGMFVYANSQNPGNRAHLIGMFGGEGIAENVIKRVVDALPEKLKRIVDAQIDWYDNVQYYRMNPVFLNEHEVPLPKEQRYFPIQSVKTDRAESAIVADYLARHSSKLAGVQKGMTKMRVHSQAPFKQMDYVGTVVRNILSTEHYIAYNDAIRDVSRFLNHKEVRAAIEDKNEEVYSQIKEWLKAVAYGRVGGSENILDKITDYMRGNFSTFALGLRLTTSLQQFASLPRGMGYLDKKSSLMKSASLFMKHPIRALDFAANKSGLMASRKNSYERELAESYEKGSVKQFAGLQNATGKLKEWAMVHIGLTDRIVATILWSARYQEGLTRGYTDAEAVSLADELIRKTQSRGGVLYMPAIYRGSGLSRAFMMFSSDLNQAANLLFEVAGKWNIQPTQENLTQIALFFMMPTLVIYLVNNALRLDEPEDYVYEFMHQFAGAIPFLGPIMDATVKTFLDEAKSARGLIPDKTWTRYAADLSPAPLQTYETLAEGIAKKDPLKFAEAAAQFTGIPFAAPKQYIQGAAKLLSGDVPNWRSLIWGERKAMAKNLFGDMAKRLYSPRPKSNDSDVYSKWYKKLNPSEKERFRNYIDEVYLPLDLKREQNSIKKEVRQIQSDRKKVER